MMRYKPLFRRAADRPAADCGLRQHPMANRRKSGVERPSLPGSRLGMLIANEPPAVKGLRTAAPPVGKLDLALRSGPGARLGTVVRHAHELARVFPRIRNSTATPSPCP